MPVTADPQREGSAGPPGPAAIVMIEVRRRAPQATLRGTATVRDMDGQESKTATCAAVLLSCATVATTAQVRASTLVTGG